MDYKKIYKDFISDRKEKNYPEGTRIEKHHIIPRCLGGNNSEDNLINLSIRDHIFAHLVLTKIYPDNPKIRYAAFAMTTLKEREEIAIKFFSTRILSEIRENAFSSRKGSGNPMYGRKQSEETKKLISKINTGRKFTKEQSKAHSIKMKNRVITDEWKNNISKSMKGKPHPHRKPNLSDEVRKKKSDLLKERFKNGHPNSKKIIDKNTGEIYKSITDLSKKLGISRATLSNWIKNNPEKGYNILND